MSVLNDIYYGKLRPFERNVRDNPDYARVVHSIIAQEKALRGFLESLPKTDKELEILSEMLTSKTKLCGIMELERFKDGFLLGVNMMTELLALSGKA